MSGKKMYAEDYDSEILGKLKERSFDELTGFRSRMKSLEEHVLSGGTSGGIPAPGYPRIRTVARMGGHYDVMAEDPITRRSKRVARFDYDARGRRVRTLVAWKPGDPRSVAAVFGIPFVSAFGDLPEKKPQDLADRETVEKVRHRVGLDAMVQRAREEAELEEDRKAFERSQKLRPWQVTEADRKRAERFRKRRWGK